MKSASISYDVEKHQILITILDREIWNAAIEAAAKIAEQDHRSEIAKSVSYEPEFHKAERRVAAAIRSLCK